MRAGGGGGGGCGFNSVKNERVIELLVTPDYAIAFLLFCRYFLYSISKPNKEGSPTIDLSTGSNDTDTNPGCQTSQNLHLEITLCVS